MWRRERDHSRLHALAFEEPEGALEAVRRLRHEGFEVADVHTPFPVHGMEDAIGLRPTRLAVATAVGAVTGGLLKLLFQTWVHVVDWPYTIGGKPDLAFPAMVPVTFEIAVLIAAFATLGALLLRCRLHPRLRPGRPPRQPEVRVTDDRFVVLVRERDASFSPGRFRALVTRLRPAEVYEAGGAA